jgi:hypothetical protein
VWPACPTPQGSARHETPNAEGENDLRTGRSLRCTRHLVLLRRSMHAGRPRQQFRRRPLDEDAGPDDTAPVEAAAAPPAASVPAAVRKAAPQRATLLSFADDGGDGNDALAASPPQLAGKKRVVAAAVRASNAQPVTGAGALRPPSGEYSAARLKEVRLQAVSSLDGLLTHCPPRRQYQLAAAQRTLPGSLRPAVASAADVRPIQPRVIASSVRVVFVGCSSSHRPLGD